MHGTAFAGSLLVEVIIDRHTHTQDASAIQCMEGETKQAHSHHSRLAHSESMNLEKTESLLLFCTYLHLCVNILYANVCVCVFDME